MLICGYSGIGKTTYCKTHANAYDLDSSTFGKIKNWEAEYIKHAQRLAVQGKAVFISAHKEVIEYLQRNNIPFILAIPAECKETWELRLKLRYSQTHADYALNALRDFYQNYDKDMQFYHNLKGVKIIRVTCKVQTTLANELANC